MKHSKRFTKLALGALSLGTAFTAANDAMALDAGQCLPMAQMNEALKADGQRTMIIGNGTAFNNTHGSAADVRISYFVNTITSNQDGSLGYQLEGDRPLGEPSQNVCIRAKLSDVHLYDARVESIPSAAYLGGRFNDIVNENASKGTRPMVIANTVFGSGSTLRNGLPIVMFGNMADKGASITTALADGSPQMLVFMTDTGYTQAAIQKLDNSKLAAPK